MIVCGAHVTNECIDMFVISVEEDMLEFRNDSSEILVQIGNLHIKWLNRKLERQNQRKSKPALNAKSARGERVKVAQTLSKQKRLGLLNTLRDLPIAAAD